MDLVAQSQLRHKNVIFLVEIQSGFIEIRSPPFKRNGAKRVSISSSFLLEHFLVAVKALRASRPDLEAAKQRGLPSSSIMANSWAWQKRVLQDGIIVVAINARVMFHQSQQEWTNCFKKDTCQHRPFCLMNHWRADGHLYQLEHWCSLGHPSRCWDCCEGDVYILADKAHKYQFVEFVIKIFR